VTTLMICSAVWALTMLAFLIDAACPAATANSAGIRKIAVSPVDGHRDVVAAEAIRSYLTP